MSENNPQGYGNAEQANTASAQSAQDNPQQAPYGGFYGYPPHMVPPQFSHHAQSMGQAHFPPHMGHMPPPMWHHPMWMNHPGYCHPSMMPPPHWQSHPHMHPSMHPPAQEQSQGQEEVNDALFEQAQAMLEGALGEDAGMFKELLGSFGMNDKEFWKGAMVGAAAALLLSNENVRGKLMGMVSGAGDMLKTGGCAVKDGATSTAKNVKENVSTSGEIFRDTYEAGKQGFHDSVERHQQETQEPEQVEPLENDAVKPA
ncbi:YtxH domain-containing protein [Vibrio kasasachensis]|uniref:YtxH domain-containing protein n=1 Tax=Vibrio kasasachensis TaxID=2910248 RepID=UPI003D0CFF41